MDQTVVNQHRAYPCTYCGAKRGEPCVDMRRTPAKRAMRGFHIERQREVRGNTQPDKPKPPHEAVAESLRMLVSSMADVWMDQGVLCIRELPGDETCYSTDFDPPCKACAVLRAFDNLEEALQQARVVK